MFNVKTCAASPTKTAHKSAAPSNVTAFPIIPSVKAIDRSLSALALNAVISRLYRPGERVTITTKKERYYSSIPAAGSFPPSIETRYPSSSSSALPIAVVIWSISLRSEQYTPPSSPGPLSRRYSLRMRKSAPDASQSFRYAPLLNRLKISITLFVLR